LAPIMIEEVRRETRTSETNRSSASPVVADVYTSERRSTLADLSHMALAVKA
jgi:hypothetical protein